MSALASEADVHQSEMDFRLGPKADIADASLNRFICDAQRGCIVTPSAFAVLRKLAREFVVSERRRSDRKQCRNNPDRHQHKEGYRALPTVTACNPKKYWKKT